MNVKRQTLIDDFDARQRQDIGKAIENLSGNNPDEISAIIGDIGGIADDVTKELYVGQLHKKTGISKRTIERSLKKLTTDEPVTSTPARNVLIVHPSYDSQKDFIFLGFKEMTLDNNRPSHRNIYVIAKSDGTVESHTQPVIEMDGSKVIADERERILINLDDRWSHVGLQAFLARPMPPSNMYQAVKDALNGYIDLQREYQYGLIAAWIMATYFHREFYAMPFLYFYGKKGSGKSRSLDILERLAFNAMKIKGVSVPAMSDSVDGVRGTFLLDQAESLSEKQNLEMLGIFADSYTPGGGKRRIVHITNKSRKVLEFETYSPKAFASIRDIDTDLKDRCIEIVMVRSDKEYPYPEPFLPIWGELRDGLYRLMLTKWPEVRDIYKKTGDGMVARVRELWRPIETMLTLAEVAKDEYGGIKQTFLDAMVETQAGLTEFEAKLVEAIITLVGDQNETVLTVEDIVEAMNMPEGDRFKKRDQLRIAGQTIFKMSLATKRAGRSGNKKAHVFTSDHVKSISRRYEIVDLIDASTDSSIMAGLHTVDTQIPIDGIGGIVDGTEWKLVVASICVDIANPIDDSQTPDNQGLRLCVDEVDSFGQIQKKSVPSTPDFCSITPLDDIDDKDDVFVPEEETLPDISSKGVTLWES